MDSRYRFSANMPNRYEQISNNNHRHHNLNNGNRSIPLSNRYFHRAPVMFSQQHLRTPPPPFSSSYLGPLQQHRPRFLSAWDLAPAPTIYLSSRNIAATTPTPTSASKQHDEGACILNSCAVFFSSNWVHTHTYKLCNISLISFFFSVYERVRRLRY
jgi:hypothetical protein